MSASAPTAAYTAATTRGQTANYATYGRTVKIAGVDKTAIFSAPRLDPSLDPSTFRVDRYTSTLRILKASVSGITTPAAWLATGIQLPEGAGWRDYRVVTEPVDVRIADEWRVEIESL